MAEWASDSNDALTLSLVRASEDKEALTDDEEFENFHPTFTYPIFGDDEKIYGYQDLVIDLKFASGSLAQYLSISYSERISSSVADDIEGTLFKFIPPDYLKNESEFTTRVERDAKEFKPMGELIHSYTKSVSSSEDVKKKIIVDYEVYYLTWKTTGFRDYHRRMQLFILLFIEAGSYIQEEEDAWEFVVLFEKRRRNDADSAPTYHFVGYSTLYPFYHFPERVRMRLSQFVILPPYQRKGHGSALYSAIYNFVLGQSRIAELTVEDPAEAFEDLRDRCDLRMLINHESFCKEAFGGQPSTGILTSKVKGKLFPPVEKGWVEKWRQELKIAGRQFSRLVEMLILKSLDPKDARAMRAYRLQVKERIYRFNYERLIEIDKQERIEKLEETFQSVITDYERILSMATF